MKHKVLLMKDLNPFFLNQYDNIDLKLFELNFWDIKALYKDYKKIDSGFLSNKQMTDLWKSNDKNYNEFLKNFLILSKDVKIIYFNIFCPFPPEWVFLNLTSSINIYFCNDDPHKSYERSAGAVWAFDLITHWSPTYDSYFNMKEILSKWGAKKTMLLPLSLYTISNERSNYLLSTLSDNIRPNDVLYVGSYYRKKYDFLVFLKKKLKNKLKIAGKWPLKGYIGFLGFLKGRPNLNYKISKLSVLQKENIHLESKMVINFHLNENMEHGNLRTFESIYYGNLLITDRGILNDKDYFFLPNKEAIYYNNVNEIPEIVNYYIENPIERKKIVSAAISKFQKEFNLEIILEKLFTEAIKIIK